MKKLLVATLLLLGGCQQLIHGQAQTVKLIDGGKRIYFTSCGGSADYWGGCYERARKACQDNYVVLSRDAGAVDGKRDLTFKCVN